MRATSSLLLVATCALVGLAAAAPAAPHASPAALKPSPPKPPASKPAAPPAAAAAAPAPEAIKPEPFSDLPGIASLAAADTKAAAKAADAQAKAAEAAAKSSFLRGGAAAAAVDPDVYHYDISADFWLNAHNEVYRPRHRSPPVQWDEFLASQAQAWCEVQAQRLTPQMLKPQHPAMGEEREHFLSDTQGDYAGQNLAVVVTPTPGLDPAHARHVANAAAAQWYGEAKKYNFKSPVMDMGTFQFTQLVWRSSTRVGCGAARIGGVSSLG